MLVAQVYLIVLFFTLQVVTLYGFGFYVRRKTGQGLAGKLDFMRQIPRSMRWMPIVATVATLFMYAYALIFVVFPKIRNYYLPIESLQDGRVAALGMVLLALGTILFVISQFQLGLSYRINLPTENVRLVTNGLYSISRNPLYMALFIAFLGIFLMLPNWIFLVCWCFYVLNYHFKITTLEEPFLSETFGDAYRDYCRRVNRYF
jgi:protein-S-isoprenylcysteine O-methyltransferase Ste14